MALVPTTIEGILINAKPYKFTPEGQKEEISGVSLQLLVNVSDGSMEVINLSAKAGLDYEEYLQKNVCVHGEIFMKNDQKLKTNYFASSI